MPPVGERTRIHAGRPSHGAQEEAAHFRRLATRGRAQHDQIQWAIGLDAHLEGLGVTCDPFRQGRVCIYGGAKLGVDLRLRGGVCSCPRAIAGCERGEQ
jgi:hypothetical protein